MQPLPPVALLSSMWVGGGGAPCHSGVGGGGGVRGASGGYCHPDMRKMGSVADKACWS